MAILTCSAALSVLVLEIVLAQPVDYLQAVNNSISNRLKIQSWDIRVFHEHAQADVKAIRIIDEHLIFDGARHRRDAQLLDESELRGVTRDPYLDSVYITNGERWSYSTRQYTSGETNGITCTSVGQYDLPVNIRGFGMNVNGLRGMFPPESVLLKQGATNHAVNYEVIAGRSCVALTLDYSGGTGRAWLDPEKSWSPIRFEYIRLPGNGKNDAKLISEIELSEHTKSKTWFPSVITYEYWSKEQLVEKCRWRIQVNSLNEDIPNSHFDPASFSAPAGTGVYKGQEPFNGNLIWDGSKIAQEDTRLDSNSRDGLTSGFAT